MKKIINFYTILLLFLLSGCGDSIKDAVEDLPVTKKYTIIDVLKKSKLIDRYEMKVISDDPLRGEVGLLIQLKKDAIISDQKLLKYDNDAHLVIFVRFHLSQTITKDEWSIGRTIIKGQLSTGEKSLSKIFYLHPSILVNLANNEKINVDELKDAKDFYWSQ